MFISYKFVFASEYSYQKVVVLNIKVSIIEIEKGGIVYNKINKVIGTNISALRRSMNLKQEAFAMELNSMLKRKYNINATYDFKTISKWEMGKSIPRLDVLIAISKEYNLSLDELLKDNIEDVVEKSNFSNSEENLLNEFIKNPAVCTLENGKLVSAFNPKMYKYGQLSYLADNLVEYRSNYSKNFSFTNATKEVEIIVGIMDVNDGKRELHYLGNGENDIVSIEKVPLDFEVKTNKNNIIKEMYYHELLNDNNIEIIKLGNGKSFMLNENFSKYDSSLYKFTKNDIPQDLDYYGVDKNEGDWTDYACLKGHYIIDDVNLFDFEGSGIYYYKKAGIFVVVLYGKIKCNDAQLVKVLSDDYKHRLIYALQEITDESVCNKSIEEIEKYLEYRKKEKLN